MIIYIYIHVIYWVNQFDNNFFLPPQQIHDERHPLESHVEYEFTIFVRVMAMCYFIKRTTNTSVT